MLKKQLITFFAVLCILLNGGCVTMAVIGTYKEHHPPAPTTASFDALRQMKTLKVEVVDETNDKRVDTGELTNAIAAALHNEPRISNHSHVTVRVDDQIPADGKLIVHLISGEDAALKGTNPVPSTDKFYRKTNYRVQFFAGDGTVLNESNSVLYFTDYSTTEPENSRSTISERRYERELSGQIIRKIFIF
jgi:hypothetical protein